VSFVFGSGSAALRTLHDDIAFGCAHAPPPFSAAFLQDHFKNKKLVQALRSCLAKRFQRIPRNGKGHLPSWSVEMRNWSMEMRSLFRVVNLGISSALRGCSLFQAARSFCAGSHGPAEALLPRPKGDWFARSWPFSVVFAEAKRG